VEITHCPYDGAAIEVEVWSGGSVLTVCPACDAKWETHGAWTRRVRGPEREKLLAIREAGVTRR
jgi:hypothetical protein